MAATNDQKNKELENSSDLKKGSKVKFLLIPVVLLVQAVIAYFLVYNSLSSEPAKAQKAKEEKPKTVGQFFEIKDIVINPAGSMGRRFFVVEMGFETKDPKLIEEAEMKRIWIRDGIINLLTKKTMEELLNIAQREQLKKEILNVVNKKLVKGKFEKLYFTKYIMQ